MRTVLLATLARRQGISFQLKTAGYEVIGTMTLNSATARHEMELSEEQFLKHSKELARLCAVPGLGWYVVEFRESKETRLHLAINPGGGVLVADRPITDADHVTKADAAKMALKGVPYFKLRKMAKDLGLDPDAPSIKPNLKESILDAQTLNALMQAAVDGLGFVATKAA